MHHYDVGVVADMLVQAKGVTPVTPAHKCSDRCAPHTLHDLKTLRARVLLSSITAGKKEALANVGGLLCCNDDKLYEALRNLTIVVEGYPT